jgi:hypothetical protein
MKCRFAAGSRAANGCLSRARRSTFVGAPSFATRWQKSTAVGLSGAIGRVAGGRIAATFASFVENG